LAEAWNEEIIGLHQNRRHIDQNIRVARLAVPGLGVQADEPSTDRVTLMNRSFNVAFPAIAKQTYPILIFLARRFDRFLGI